MIQLKNNFILFKEKEMEEKDKEIKELAKKIVQAVNDTKNDYDAREIVEKIIKEDKKNEK